MTQGTRKLLAGLLVASALCAGALDARADEYEPGRAGHPVRMLAYALHPVGVLLDYLIFRPAHWVGSREPFKTLFGHDDD